MKLASRWKAARGTSGRLISNRVGGDRKRVVSDQRAMEDYTKTSILLLSAKEGDEKAREELYRRIYPRLERFARGRVPRSMRRMTDTQEVVQDTVLRSLKHLKTFEPQGEGAFMQYLGKAVLNRIRDLARSSKNASVGLDGGEERVSAREPSPVEVAVGSETFRSYQSALETLKEDQRTAVFLHVEMGYGLQELGEAMGRSSEAARKVLFRGLRNMKEKMSRRPQ